MDDLMIAEVARLKSNGHMPVGLGYPSHKELYRRAMRKYGLKPDSDPGPAFDKAVKEGRFATAKILLQGA